MIERTLEVSVERNLFSGKAILVTGARQTGKTTLIRKVLERSAYAFRFFDGDDPTVRSLLERPNTEELEGDLRERSRDLYR
ncbi:MAG: AAA family ATPase [Flavobacteriales bacterium]